MGNIDPFSDWNIKLSKKPMFALWHTKYKYSSSPLSRIEFHFQTVDSLIKKSETCIYLSFFLPSFYSPFECPTTGERAGVSEEEVDRGFAQRPSQADVSVESLVVERPTFPWNICSSLICPWIRKPRIL